MSRKVATIGIDLGTTTSCVAGYVRGELTVIDNRDGDRITPSVVCFDKDGAQPIVGSSAILAATTTPENFVYEVKRMFGRGYHSKEVQKAMQYWPFKLKEIKTTGKAADENVSDNIGIVVMENGKERIYEPIQVSAYVLNYMFESAKQRLGVYPEFVAITVPAYFSEGAKQRTLDAATIAFSGKVDDNNNKLNVKVILLAEPTAAAIAYGSIMIKNKQVKDADEERILVFDLGGGTYDVSVLDFTYDKLSPIGHVRATDGDNFLGGSDFDRVIIEIARAKFAKMNEGILDPDAGVSHEEKLKNDLRLRREAIKVKTSLSTNMKATFNLPCYRGTKDLVFDLSRVEFERAAKALFERLKEKVKGVLLSLEDVTPIYTDDGKLDANKTLAANPSSRSQGLDNMIETAKSSISKVIMVGGSSRIPKVKSSLEEFFNETADTPLVSKKVISPLNPDEAVAYGAGYFANASCHDAEDFGEPKLLLIDQIPLNLNIETLGGVATKIIEARTPIPCKQTQVFSTAADNQTSVEIVITQGNRPVSDENYLIGRFTLSGIAPASKRVPQIEVTFDVDQNNILKVTAVDKGSGSKQCFVKNMSNQLSESDIERMKKEAEEHAQKDALFTEKTELRNQFESQIYTFQDTLDSMGLDEAKKAEIRAKLDEEEQWLRNLPTDAAPAVIKERLEKITAELPNLMKEGASKANTGNADFEEVH
ncbi:Endoplasmic reticulum chaperone BiP [Glugoides intestinalis]